MVQLNPSGDIGAAAAGLLLVVNGILEWYWWSTPKAARLIDVLAEIEADEGPTAPVLLRGGWGPAQQLIVLGAVCLVAAFLAVLVARGRLWARTAALLLAAATLLVGLFFIGVDVTYLTNWDGYYGRLVEDNMAERVPQVQALLYPGWYMWLEDCVQGFQALASLSVGVAVAYASIWDPDYFVSRKADTAPASEWDAAMARIRTRAKSAGLD